MADIPETTPVVVNSSTVAAQTRSFIRYAVTFMSFFAPKLLAHVVPSQEARVFLNSDEFAGGVTVVVTGAMALWANIETRLSRQKLIAAATAAPNDKFVVK